MYIDGDRVWSVLGLMQILHSLVHGHSRRPNEINDKSAYSLIFGSRQFCKASIQEYRSTTATATAAAAVATITKTDDDNKKLNASNIHTYIFTRT